MSEQQNRENEAARNRMVAEHLDRHRTGEWSQGRAAQAEQGVPRGDLPILNPPRAVPNAPLGGRPGIVEVDSTLSHSDRVPPAGLNLGSGLRGSRP